MTGDAAVRVVLAPNPSPMTLDGTRTYLVGRESPAVIDPGPALEAHVAAVEEALGGVRPAAILLTHSHADHAGAAPALAERTGAPVWAAGGGRGARVDRRLADGDRLETDAGTLLAVTTPGHAPDHLAFLLRQGPTDAAGLLFVGDHLMGEGDTTLVAPPEGDLADYLRSLERLRGLGAAVMYPAHGPPIPDPAAALDRYAEHREARIRQVRDALRGGGPARPGALVRRVYGADLHPGLARAAEGSLRAVLGYLERRGEVRRGLLGRYQMVS
ncbi:MAG TPA: MBL fold metallo-hydrolase [Longimicrobiaceae bacterium]|nr:MBL fold metallo-hydrolase [Longimicrobiaceae bacterium]